AMRVVLFLYGVAPVVRRVENFGGESVGHCFLAAASRVRDEPSNREAVAPGLLIDFDRHLISRAADSARLHFDSRLYVLDRPLEILERVFLGLAMDLSHRIIKDPLRDGFLSLPHQRVDELGHHRRVVDGVGENFSLGCYSSSWHKFFPALNRSALE